MTNEHLQHYEDMAREMIRHEDNVINHRVGWMTTWNSLLFTALGLLWGKPNTRWIILCICVLGALLSFLSYLSLLSGTRALARIRKWWAKHRPRDYAGPGIVGLEALGPTKIHWLADYCAQWDIMALLLLAAWIVAFIVSVRIHQ